MSRSTFFFLGLALLSAGNICAQGLASIDNSTLNPKFSLAGSNALEFIPNRGQLADQSGKPMPEVLYTLDSRGVKSYFTRKSMHYVFTKVTRSKSDADGRTKSNLGSQAGRRNVDSISQYRVDVLFVGSNPNAEILASDAADHYTNYYLQHCPNGITRVPAFHQIVYRELYPHIDLVFYSANGVDKDKTSVANGQGGGRLEYDFVVHPGGDVHDIRIRYNHTSSLTVNDDGSFRLISPFGEVTESAPVGYQIGKNPRESVSCGFRLKANDLIFSAGPYDRSRDLYIDPQRIWGTYFGGRDTIATDIFDIGVDRSGCVDVTGITDCTSHIATSGAYQTTFGGNTDIFLARFGPDGSIRWATYYGGSGVDWVKGIACDNGCGMVITGFTASTNAIATTGAFQTTFSPAADNGFLASFDSTGARRWGTYIKGSGSNGYGGGANTNGTGVAIDSAQNIVAVGITNAKDGLATTGAYKTQLISRSVGGNPQWEHQAAYLSKFSPGGSLQWATLYGVFYEEDMTSVCIGKNNTIFMCGTTTDTEGMVTTGAFRVKPGSNYVSRWTPSGGRVWSTYLFDSANTNISRIAAGRSGNFYLAGSVVEAGIATTGAHQTTLGGHPDGFLSKFDSTGRRIWATYYGGSQLDYFEGLVLDTSENLFACGYTESTSAIATPGEYQTTLLGPWNATIVKFDSAGHRQWGTYYGRRGWAFGIGLDRQGHIFLGGVTGTHGFEYNTPGAYDSLTVGDYNSFIGKFCDPMQVHITSIVPDTVCPGTQVTLNTKAGLASYQWYVNGNQIAGVNSQPYVFQAPLIAGSYDYTVNVVAPDQCANISDTLRIIVRQGPTVTVPAANSICPGSSTKLKATVTGSGPFLYAWTPKTGLDHPDSLQPTSSPSTPTNYSLTVTDAHGCTATKQASVTIYQAPTVSIQGKSTNGTMTACAGSPASLITTTSSGTAPFFYTWSHGADLDRADTSFANAWPAANTMYTVVVTDQHGCTSKDSVLVIVSPTPKVLAGAPISVCRGSSVKLAASVTGQQKSVQWSPGTGLSDPTILQPIASPNVTTLYTLSVTNSLGCVGYDTVLVSVADSLEPSVSAKGPLTVCAGDTLQLSTASGYSTYQWSSGENTSSIEVKKTGDYFVRVTSSAGCSGTSKPLHVTVLPDSIPHPRLSVTSSTICSGDSIQIEPTGTFASYLWSTGQTTQKIFVSKAGQYSLTATNPGGCSGTTPPMTLTVQPRPQVALTSTGATTFCEGDSLMLSATPGYHYAWSNGAAKLTDTASTLVVKTSGTFAVTATNDGGCAVTTSAIAVTVTPGPHPLISGPGSICVNGTASYSIPATTGTIQWQVIPPSLGSITSGQGTSQINVTWGGIATGTLEADVSLDGCTGTSRLPIEIDAHLSPKIAASGPPTFCEGDSITLDAGAGYTSYQWSKDGGTIAGATKATYTTSNSGSYAVFVTNVSGCDGSSQSFGVVVNPIPSKPIVTQNGLQLSSTSAAQFAWFVDGASIPLATTQSIDPTKSGSYTVVITDANGCTRMSDPFDYGSKHDRTATVELPVRPISSAATTISEALVLSQSSGIFDNVQSTGAVAPWVAQVRMHSSELTPQNPAGTLVGGDWIVPLSGSIVDNSVASGQRIALDSLYVVSALPANINIACAEILLDTFYFVGKDVKITTASGQVCVTGACAPWVSATDTAFTIIRISPNPSSGAFAIRYHLPVEGPVEIVLEDLLGRRTSTLKQNWVQIGDYNETYAVDGVGSGVYRLVVRSGGRALQRMIELAR